MADAARHRTRPGVRRRLSPAESSSLSRTGRKRLGWPSRAPICPPQEQAEPPCALRWSPRGAGGAVNTFRSHLRQPDQTTLIARLRFVSFRRIISCRAPRSEHDGRTGRSKESRASQPNHYRSCPSVNTGRRVPVTGFTANLHEKLYARAHAHTHTHLKKDDDERADLNLLLLLLFLLLSFAVNFAYFRTAPANGNAIDREREEGEGDGGDREGATPSGKRCGNRWAVARSERTFTAQLGENHRGSETG